MCCQILQHSLIYMVGKFLFTCLTKAISLRCPSLSISLSLCLFLPGGDSPGRWLHWFDSEMFLYAEVTILMFIFLQYDQCHSASSAPWHLQHNVPVFLPLDWFLSYQLKMAFQWHCFCIKDVKSDCICFVQCTFQGSPQRAQLSVLQQEGVTQLSQWMNKLLADSAYASDLASGTQKVTEKSVINFSIVCCNVCESGSAVC